MCVLNSTNRHLSCVSINFHMLPGMSPKFIGKELAQGQSELEIIIKLLFYTYYVHARSLYFQVAQNIFFLNINKLSQGFPWWSDDKESACNAADQIWVLSLGCEHPLEKGMATHSSILA